MESYIWNLFTKKINEISFVSAIENGNKIFIIAL